MDSTALPLPSLLYIDTVNICGSLGRYIDAVNGDPR